ncbi:MAG: hypothetical protein NTY19_06515 [Planctomycetota bacterium]|nr:hypothetical protein [Planctomycetota bacterium]
MSKVLQYFVDICPARHRQALYALGLLLEGGGLAACPTTSAEDADIVYSRLRPERCSANSVWIKADGASDWNQPDAKIGWSDEVPYLYQNISPASSSEAGDMGGDCLYSTYAIVTGVMERNEQRDEWGVIVATGSQLQRAGMLGLPVVAMYVDRLLRLLQQRRGPFPTLDRWPNGKRFAVVLTHDVDNPFSRLPLSLRGAELLRALRTRRWCSTARWIASWGVEAGRRICGARSCSENDPNFCFDKWREVERKLGTRSCCYVAVTTRYDAHASPQDITYDFRQPLLREVLCRAIEQGGEIGLHASINSRNVAGRFSEEKELLESVLNGYRLKGLRHHYWTLDRDRPECTLQLHAKAGFQYDSSLGLNDSPGFRRGMAWPYQPFDPEQGTVIPIHELPPTLMDGGIFYRPVSPAEGQSQIEMHLQTVARYGGAAVLDWHIEMLNARLMNGAGPALCRVLTDLSLRSDVAWFSPVELLNWWTRRQGLLTCR